MAALIAGVVAVVGSLVPFIWPIPDHPTHADAIVVLAGDHGERIALGLRMIGAGVAPTLVLAGKPDSKNIDRLCQARLAFEVVCLKPAHDSTRNEARATAELAAERGWRHLVVVTTTSHVTRARLLFDRCVEGDVQFVGATAPYNLRAKMSVVIHEWLGTADALIAQRGC